MDSKEKMLIAYKALDEKKGEDIKVIDISDVSVMADYFVIATASSPNQVQAMTDNVEEKMHKAGIAMKQMEGNKSSSWILMDYTDVIIHVFDKENRLFYDLERIWKDGKTVDME
ncbi:MAG: ribosome silencing factor [Lachnospiraceae bacterium]|nr:ribosome silencing factor [Lachnospiraceae bacterium]